MSLTCSSDCRTLCLSLAYSSGLFTPPRELHTHTTHAKMKRMHQLSYAPRCWCLLEAVVAWNELRCAWQTWLALQPSACLCRKTGPSLVLPRAQPTLLPDVSTCLSVSSPSPSPRASLQTAADTPTPNSSRRGFPRPRLIFTRLKFHCIIRSIDGTKRIKQRTRVLCSVHLSGLSPKSLQPLLVVLLGKSHVLQELWIHLPRKKM